MKKHPCKGIVPFLHSDRYVGIKCVMYGYSCAYALYCVSTGDVVKNYCSVCSCFIDRRYLDSQGYEMTQFRSICFLALKCSGISNQRNPVVFRECFRRSLNTGEG